MSLFNTYIEKINGILALYEKVEWEFDANNVWETTKFPRFILQKESSAELGGESLDALGITVTTSTLGFESGTVLIGQDLKDLKGNVPFTRITLIKTKSKSADEQSNYDTIKGLDYLRFNVNVVGFMSRASSINLREEVRVSKKEIKKGLTFEKVGNTLVNEYLKLENVEKVKVIFITKKTGDFGALKEIANTVVKAQDALNHVYDNIVLDCKSCTLKPLCDEVEGMREEHFRAVQELKNKGSRR